MKKSSANKFIRKSCFTLFELLISVGLLVVLSVVLLRTLMLTSDYWSKTDEQNQLQADAKTFFSLLSDDLGNLIYTGNNGGFYAPMDVEINRLCMVTHNRLQGKIGSKDPYSDVSKVVYLFTAPSGSASGKITRMCTSDAAVNGNTLNKYDMTSDSRSAFYPATLDNSAMVIDTVADLQISAYMFEKDGTEDKPKKISYNDTFTSSSVRMIHVKLVLLPVNRFREYNDLSSDAKKNDYVVRHGKIYYKTYWVKPSNQ